MKYKDIKQAILRIKILESDNQRLRTELDWIDSHLFQPVDTKATRQFITEDTIESKRLLKICNLLDRQQKPLLCMAGKRFWRFFITTKTNKGLRPAKGINGKIGSCSFGLGWTTQHLFGRLWWIKSFTQGQQANRKSLNQ